VACGGTHLRRAGEVGTLVLRRKKLGAGNERVEIILADEVGVPPSQSR
jgi:Ser-tRNA(Ala) deacylase AlaX